MNNSINRTTLLAWLVALSLLVTGIVGARLDHDGLWYDEVFTMRNAGGAGYGPLSLGDLYRTIQRDDPYQAIGYPLTIALWGQGVGWSEFAGRTSSLLFALLGMAWTIRLARDSTRNDWLALLSGLIFISSAFTIHYAHELRAFTYVTIFATMTIWAYQQIIRHNRPPAYAVLALGGIGILYAHYYAAMLLIALALYHLLFAPKNRRWWTVPLVGIVIMIAFLPQVPAFIEGFTRFDPANVEKAAMPMPQVLISLVYYLGNGRMLITLLLLVAGLAIAWRCHCDLRLVIAFAVLGTLVLLLSNEALHILEPTRLRYAIFLWSPYAIWLAAGAWWVVERITRRQAALGRGLMWLLPLLIVINALFAINDARFAESIEGTETPRMRTLTNLLRAHGTSSDLFAFYNGTSQQAWYIQDTLRYSTYDIPMPTLTTAAFYDEHAATRTWANEQLQAVQRVWYGANRTFGMNQVHTDFLAQLADDFVLCQNWVMTEALSLDLYARSSTFCGTDTAPQMAFGGFTLSASQVRMVEDRLQIELAWQMDETVPPETYSLAVHLLAAEQAAPLAQVDVGMSHEPFIAQTITLDISQVPDGTYALALIIYDWRSGTRLVGHDFRTDQASDRLILTAITRE